MCIFVLGYSSWKRLHIKQKVRVQGQLHLNAMKKTAFTTFRLRADVTETSKQFQNYAKEWRQKKLFQNCSAICAVPGELPARISLQKQFSLKKGASSLTGKNYLLPKASRFASPRLNWGMRAHAVVLNGEVSPRFKKWYATPAIMAPLSPHSFMEGI